MWTNFEARLDENDPKYAAQRCTYLELIRSAGSSLQKMATRRRCYPSNLVMASGYCGVSRVRRKTSISAPNGGPF